MNLLERLRNLKVRTWWLAIINVYNVPELVAFNDIRSTPMGVGIKVTDHDFRPLLEKAVETLEQIKFATDFKSHAEKCLKTLTEIAAELDRLEKK